ncbi:MAG: DUF368 domain-containing protein [Clostridia bacterium]|nr:DUF368 domain-containing protein [Clostridia bacterium]
MSDLEIELVKYSKKTWTKSAVLGFFIGLAVIVPGISGSTVAIIFKLYRQFLYAIGHLFEQFKKCFAFLLPIGIGMVVGVVGGFIGVKALLEILPFAVICLFAGLMIGAFPAVKDEIKGVKFNAKRIILLCVGIAIPVAIGALSAFLSIQTGGGVDAFATVQWWQVLLALVIGYVMAITQVVPGLSASAILMAIGWFSSIMDSVSMTYWSANGSIFFVYGGLAIGFLLGLFTFSRFLDFLFKKVKEATYCTVVGLSIGSIISMFCNGDVMEVYMGWTTAFNPLDCLLGIGLLAVGIALSYLLVRIQRKKDAEEAVQTQQN